MSEEEAVEDEKVKKSGFPFLIGVLLAILGGCGGFFAVSSGVVFGTESASHDDSVYVAELLDIAYVDLQPMTISIVDGAKDRHLRFRAQIETAAQYKAEVETLTPRILDVLNTYLRALHLEDVRRSSALVALRGQMLRRIQMVTGEGRVNDLLIAEFVLN